jgi:hypothetical protein
VKSKEHELAGAAKNASKEDRASSVIGVAQVIEDAGCCKSLCLVFLVAIAFFEPRVSPIVITTDFPEPSDIFSEKFNAADPFGAFPGVELRHNQAERPAVVRSEILTIKAMGEDNIVIDELLKCKIRRVSSVTMDHDVSSSRLETDQGKELLGFDAFPMIIKT